ncbi:S-adenosylmethionine synthetase N-terminal domain-containing protein [Bacillus licheniformis]|nr:S-adenosylmethionine synthetase N-terminal domain-containing protein [Bacillus licheniformis]
MLKKDPNARVACETSVTTGLVLVSGEITTSTYVDIPKQSAKRLKKLATHVQIRFDAETCAVLTSIDEQSPDIAMGVDQALEAREGAMSDAEIEAIGAGDQGLMFGLPATKQRNLCRCRFRLPINCLAV